MDHLSLAEALVHYSNDQVQYGLTQNQTVHRKGPIITSQNNQGGNVVYCKNQVQTGIHMPSKGLYNLSKQKPRTAADGNPRKKFSSVTNRNAVPTMFANNEIMSQDTNTVGTGVTGYVRKGIGFGGSVFGSLPTHTNNPSNVPSNYKGNINNINMF